MRWIGQITYDEVAYFREDVIIEAGNKLGIGTTSPASALHVAGTVQVGVDDTGHDVIFYGATSGKKMQWDESADTLIVDGSLDINGSSNISGEAFFTNSIDVTSSGHSTRFRDGHKVHFNTARTASIYTSSDDLYIENGVDDKDIIFRCDDGSGGVTTYFQLDGGEGRTVFKQNALWEDSKAIYMGNGADLRLYHNGSNSFIESHTGNLTIDSAANDADIIFKGTDGSADITALTLDMSDAGTAIFNHDIRLADNGRLKLGTGNDMQFLHDGSNTYMDNSTGDLYITNTADDKDIIFRSDDGSGGVEEYFRLDGSAGGGAPVTKFPDGSRLQFGGGGDANMNHDGTNFTFSVVTGDLRVKCDTDDGNLKLQCDDGSGGAANYLVLDGGDKTLIAEVPLILEADSTVGWHGSVTRVKILPRDFQPDNSGRPALTVIDTNVAHLASNASSNLFASIPIPTGFKATHVKIHGSDTGQTFTVKEANIANKTTVTKGTATALETEKAITNVNSTTTNYILIQVSSDGSADEIHGGYMTIAAI